MSTAEGAFDIKNGKFQDARIAATLPVQEHFELGKQALEESAWREAAKQFRIMPIRVLK